MLTQDAYLTYRIEAPTDVSRFTYGGRLHNFAAGSYIDFLHSYDGGTTWIRSFHFTGINKPWDVIHYETIADVPPGVRSVLFKFVFHNTSPTVARATGLYNARMEVNHLPAAGGPKPIDVTFRWKEMREDRSLVDRSHRQRVTAFPFKYIVNVGGSDHPVMESLKLQGRRSGRPDASRLQRRHRRRRIEISLHQANRRHEPRGRTPVHLLESAERLPGVGAGGQHHDSHRRHCRGALHWRQCLLVGAVLECERQP